MTETVRSTWHSRARKLAGSALFRLAVTAGLLAWVGLRLDWDKMGRRLEDGHPGLFVAAVGLIVAALVVGAVRWARILRVLDLPETPGRIARIYAISSFSSTFLPTSMGGDVARALMVARSGPRLTRALMSILIDRGAALGGLLVVAWLGVVAEPGAVPHGARTGLLVATAAVVLGIAVVCLLTFRVRGIGRRLPERIRTTLGHARDAARACLRDRELLVWLVVTSVAFQALVAAQIVLLADAVDVDLPFATAATGLALVTMATIMPISIAGFGVREASYVVVLGNAGISATDATLISLLTVATLFLASTPGALLLLRRGAPRDPAGAS